MATYTINKVKSPEGDIYNLQDASALHSIPVATTENVGGVKAGGTGISIDANGVISSTAPGQMVWYGTSNTSSGTASKTVVCSGFTLTTGAIIGVLFTTANASGTLQLNVNSTGAKDVVVGHSAVSSTTNVLKWSANTLLYFMYNGTSFEYITAVSAASVEQPRGANTWYGTSSTAAGTTAKTSTIANYVLTKGSVVCVTFTYANTADAPTLNINSTGAKAIYCNNAVTSSSNKLTWDAGETVTFIYSGLYYYFVTKSKQQSGGITSESDPVYSASPAAGITASDITNWNNTTSNAVEIVETSFFGDPTITDNTFVPVNNTININRDESISISYNSGTPNVISMSAPIHCYHITCDSTASSTTKTANGSVSYYEIGQIFAVTFTNGNTASAFTLNISSLGAKDVYVGNSIMNGTTNVLKCSAHTTMYFLYDGYFQFITAISDGTKAPARGANTWVGTCSIAVGTTAKTAAIDNFVLTKGALASIIFTNGNSANVPTLNINSTGAKSIYINNAVTSSSNKLTLDANEVATFIYDGTQYHLVCTSKEHESSFAASAASGITASDITNWNSKTSNVGTVTSVRVQGTAPISSSVSTAQTGSLDTTISISDATTSASGAMSAADKAKLDGLKVNISSVGESYDGTFTAYDGTKSFYTAIQSDANQVTLTVGDTASPTSPHPSITLTANNASYDTSTSTTTYSSGYMSGQDKEKLDKISFPESAISNINNLEFDCTPSDPGIRITANYGNDTYQSSLYYIANDGSSSGHGVICGTSDFVTPNTSCAVYDPRSTAGLARTETVGSTKRYVNGYMTGQDKEKLDKVNLSTDSDVTVLTNGIKSNNVNSGVQNWRLFLGDYVSTHNYGVNSKTIMGLRGDNAVGDGLFFASYGTDGALDGKVAIGSTGIRSRDSSGDIAWNLKMPLTTVSLGSAQSSARSLSIWRGFNDDTFGDYIALGGQNDDATDGFRTYIGENALRFSPVVGSTFGTTAWYMFPSRIPQFNNNTSKTVSSVTSTYTYTGATSSSGTAYWYYYMDDSHIYGWVRLNCGNATSSTSKSTVLNLPTAFTSGITIATGTSDGGRFFITPFGTNGGTVDRMWVNAYNATTITVNCTVASANTTAIPMNMMFFFNYTKNS